MAAVAQLPEDWKEDEKSKTPRKLSTEIYGDEEQSKQMLMNLTVLEGILNTVHEQPTAKELEEANLLDATSKHLYSTIDALKRQLEYEQRKASKAVDQVEDLNAQIHHLTRDTAQLTNERNSLRNELATSLGRNAELNVRSRVMKESIKLTKAESNVRKTAEKQAVHNVSTREEKIRKLNHDKKALEIELDHLKKQYVEEKLDKATVYREIKLWQGRNEAAAKKHQVEHEEMIESKNELYLCIEQLQGELVSERESYEREERKAKAEREVLVEAIAKMTEEFKKSKQEMADSLERAKENAINDERSIRAITMQRFMDENQLLRHRVVRMEKEIERLGLESTPAEKARRRLEGSTRNQADTYHVDLIGLKAHVKELENLLKHSKDQQQEYASLLRAAEDSIHRISDEKRISALEDLTTNGLVVSPPISRSSRRSMNSPRRRVKSRASSVLLDDEITDSQFISEATRVKVENSKLQRNLDENKTLLSKMEVQLDSFKTQLDEVRQVLLGGTNGTGDLVLSAKKLVVSISRMSHELQEAREREKKLESQLEEMSMTIFVDEDDEGTDCLQNDGMQSVQEDQQSLEQAMEVTEKSTDCLQSDGMQDIQEDQPSLEQLEVIPPLEEPPVDLEGRDEPSSSSLEQDCDTESLKLAETTTPPVRNRLAKRGARLDCNTYLIVTIWEYIDPHRVEIRGYSPENPDHEYLVQLAGESLDKYVPVHQEKEKAVQNVISLLRLENDSMYILDPDILNSD